MPLAGFLAVQHTLSLWGAGVAGAVGCVLGSLVAYGIGATGGRPVLLRYGRYVLISPHDADRANTFFARYGAPAIFLTRLMPIVRPFISLPAGIARMPLGPFVVYTFLGSLPWRLALAFAGLSWARTGKTLVVSCAGSICSSSSLSSRSWSYSSIAMRVVPHQSSEPGRMPHTRCGICFGRCGGTRDRRIHRGRYRQHGRYERPALVTSLHTASLWDYGCGLRRPRR